MGKDRAVTAPTNRKLADRRSSIAKYWMVSCGFYEPALHDATCHSGTGIYSRFQRLRKHDVWKRVLAEFQTLDDQQGSVNWKLHFEDCTIIPAQQHAVGVKKYPRSGNTRARSGRLRHQTVCSSRREWAVIEFCLDARATTRDHNGGNLAGTRSCVAKIERTQTAIS